MADPQSSPIRDEIGKLLAPLTSAATATNGTSMLIQVIGHVGALGQDPELQAEVKRLARLAEDIAALDLKQLGSFEGISQVLTLAHDLMSAVREVESVINDPKLVLQAQNLGRELTESLFSIYMRSHHPRLFRTGVVLALITPAEDTDPQQMVLENGKVSRLAWERDQLHFDRISTLIEDPFGLLAIQYLPDGMAHAQDAFLAAARLFSSLRDLAISLDLGWISDFIRVAPEIVIPGSDVDEGGGGGPWPPEDDMLGAPDLGPFDLSQFQRDYRPRFTVYLPGDIGGVPAASKLGIMIIASSAEHPDEVRGYILALGGEFNWSEVRGDWRLELLTDGTVPAFIISPDGLKLAQLGTPLTGATVKFLIERISEPGEPAFVLGSPNGTRIELGALRFRADLALSPERQAIVLSLEANSGALILAAGEADGFLNAVLPKKGVRTEFNLGLILSSERGFELKGGAGLELLLATNVTLGPVIVRTIRLSAGAQQGGVQFRVTGGFGVRLGPVLITIEEFGVQVTVAFPSAGGNFGPVDLDERLQGPSGASLTIDGGGFTGGGFLRYVEADQHYEGILELEFEDRISLKAIGLLTTRLPDGSAGFSLLIVITAEFNPPFELGLGFKLSAVGGLLGLNRTANAECLRSGLRDKTLDSVLFPQNLIENADRILNELRQVFPPKADRFIFGPMARITWGTPTLLTIDLGLLMEIPDPVRVLILGVIRALLPDEDAKLLQLQINFLGVIDFEAQRFALDASLYDSKLLTYTLSGDMAVRLNWGAEPNFLLTVGGFHPAYQPPPLNLPTLRRLSLQLTDGDNPRITLETYFAITSNTVQFGAKAELLAKAGSFSVYGFLSFDVLFQFNPFYFIASINAKVALRAGSNEIACISLDFTLEGPTPWHAKGTAKLKICWFLTIKVHFDKTFGEERDTRLEDIAVLPLLRAALSDNGNWEAQAPVNRRLLVTLKQVQEVGDQVVVYPFGVLTILQKVVPLDIEIQKVGSQRPSDGVRFDIEQVLAGEVGDTEALAASDVDELFAPAQFFELSDAQKLASKSFERYVSGVNLVDSEAFDGNYAVRREVAYELFYIDEQRNLIPRRDPLRPDFLAFHNWALRGAIANSPLSHARNGKSALAPEAVQVSQEAFAVVNAGDLRLAEEGALSTTEAGAHRMMEGLIRSNPALDGEILVVPTFEVNRS